MPRFRTGIQFSRWSTHIYSQILPIACGFTGQHNVWRLRSNTHYSNVCICICFDRTDLRKTADISFLMIQIVRVHCAQCVKVKKNLRCEVKRGQEILPLSVEYFFVFVISERVLMRLTFISAMNIYNRMQLWHIYYFVVDRPGYSHIKTVEIRWGSVAIFILGQIFDIITFSNLSKIWARMNSYRTWSNLNHLSIQIFKL